jgi:hypothetical protein
MCEGDDYWTDPLKLQKQVDFLEGNLGYSMCFHEVDVMSEFQDKRILKKYSNLKKEIFKTEDFFERHIVGTCSMVFRNLSCLYKNFPSKINSGDKWLIFLLSLEGDIKFYKETMGVYRLHESGVSNTHKGIKKVYDTALLLHEFDAYSGYKFTNNCQESLQYEIDVHVLKKQKKNINDLSALKLFKIILIRIKKRLKV